MSAWRIWGMLIVVVLGAVAAVAIFAARVGSERGQFEVLTLGDPAPASGQSLHPVVIHQRSAPRLQLDQTDELGRPVTVACSTCHTIRQPNPQNRSTEQLDEFHQGLAFNHGDLSCLSCHNPGDYDTLRLADGTTVPYQKTMTLCAQCHGTQYRDYQHGAHGGMTGYWDLSRGPRTRNTCIDCHDPHAPQMPKMVPTFKPSDRFLTPAGSAVDQEGGHG